VMPSPPAAVISLRPPSCCDALEPWAGGSCIRACAPDSGPADTRGRSCTCQVRSTWGQRPTHRDRASRLAAHVVPGWGRKSSRHLWADRKLIDVAHGCSNIFAVE
jgi:hypothetical protein